MLPNAYADAAQTSLVKTASSVPEIYIPLWWFSGSYISTTATTSGSAFAQRNSTSTSTSKNLHALNSNWSPSTKYALEATLFGNTTSGSSVALWDITSNTIVSGSQFSVSGSGATAATVVRSGQFTLTPGHSYGLTVWTGASSTGYITDASLIVFPS